MLHQRKPPAPGDLLDYSHDPVSDRLSAIEARLDEITERFDAIELAVQEQ